MKAIWQKPSNGTSLNIGAFDLVRDHHRTATMSASLSLGSVQDGSKVS